MRLCVIDQVRERRLGLVVGVHRRKRSADHSPDDADRAQRDRRRDGIGEMDASESCTVRCLYHTHAVARLVCQRRAATHLRSRRRRLNDCTASYNVFSMSVFRLKQLAWRHAALFAYLVAGHQVEAKAQSVLIPAESVTAPADAGVVIFGLQAPAPAELSHIEQMTAHIRALTEGVLEASVEPQSLFEVALDDALALEIESVRLRALLRAVEQSAQPDPPQPRRGAKSVPVAEPVIATRADIEALDETQWQARMALDRARLAFYSLPADQREARLRAHAALVDTERAKESEAERQAREAEARTPTCARGASARIG